MKRSELTSKENELIERVRRAERENDTDMIIAIYAMVDRLLQEQGQKLSGRLTGFTRGQYKRAIKSIRTAQAFALREGLTRNVEDFDCTVQYIRENCLNCHVEEGKKTA